MSAAGAPVMKLDIKALALVRAGVGHPRDAAPTGIVNMIWPTYGQAFLEMMASVYPGYAANGSAAQVIIGTVYGVVDGAIAEAIFAWLYNRVAGD